MIAERLNFVLSPNRKIAKSLIETQSKFLSEFFFLGGIQKLINRKKSTKIKQRIPFTEEMIHEYNKNHMGGFDNYGVEDLYNMEDVWNEKPYDFRNVTNNGHSHSNHISINHNLKKVYLIF